MNSTVYYEEEEEKKDQQLLVWLLWMDHIIHSGVRRRPVYTVHTVGREWSTWQKSLHENKKEIFFFYYDLRSFTDTMKRHRHWTKEKKPESWTSSQRQLWQDDTGGQRQNHGHRHNMMLYGHTVIIFIIFIIGNNHKYHPVTSEPAWYYLNFISSDWYCSLSLKVHRWSISEPANPRLPFCW